LLVLEILCCISFVIEREETAFNRTKSEKYYASTLQIQILIENIIMPIVLIKAFLYTLRIIIIALKIIIKIVKRRKKIIL
jgi:hypothetical protein